MTYENDPVITLPAEIEEVHDLSEMFPSDIGPCPVNVSEPPPEIGPVTVNRVFPSRTVP